MRPTHHPSPRAFSLIELAIVLIIVATVGAIVIPGMLDHAHGRLIAAREKVLADVMAAQAWSLANPTDPARITLGTAGYTLVRGAQTASVVFERDGFSEATGVRITATGAPFGVLDFNHYGALDVEPDAEHPVIALFVPGSPDRVELDLTPSTGGVVERWLNSP